MKTVVLQTFSNYFTANITLSRLQGEGINCFLLDETTNTIYPVLGNAIGGIRLGVDERDVERASVLLKEYHEDYMKAAVCPKCGAQQMIQVPSKKTANVLTAIITWFFSSYAVSAEYVYRCSRCGYESESLPDLVGQTELDYMDTSAENI